MKEAHEIEFTIEDEGYVYGWKVTKCPGPEYGCRTYEEAKCTCDCFSCSKDDHWECENYLATGTPCNMKLMETCGLEDYLGEIGSEMIAGSTTVKVKAMHEWRGDYPVIKLQ